VENPETEVGTGTEEKTTRKVLFIVAEPTFRMIPAADGEVGG
jgi:hypothetical protein